MQSTFPACFKYLLKQKPTVRWLIAFSGTGSKFKNYSFALLEKMHSKPWGVWGAFLES